MAAPHKESIYILDFGSQYTQLIARKVRELGVYAEIKPHILSAADLEKHRPAGLIFSGSPESVYAEFAPAVAPELFTLGIPVLGICYGLQLISQAFEGQVEGAARREFGLARLVIDNPTRLLQGLKRASRVWMSHGDAISGLPEGFEALAHTENSPFAAVGDFGRNIYGVQFHPEVSHTEEGSKVLRNFLYEICGCAGGWTAESFVASAVAKVRDKIGDAKAICALSGGVDSSVAAALVYQAVGPNLTCIFVDTGLLRKDEAAEVSATFRDYFDSNLISVNAEDMFLNRLHGVTDPEEKRKIIGKTFIEIFEKEADRLESVDYLVQGTLYPDVIESSSPSGPSVTIKTHHNVGGLPEKMNLQLVEPLRDLFKDEVRRVGKELALPAKVLERHPFPGPGLAVRVLGEITKERLQILREADAIFIDELRRHELYGDVWQAFVVLLPVQAVGVMGDQRTYENVVALRAVESVDGMTADWSRLPTDFLAHTSSRIINEIRGINRVVYDISSKPPATIEWE